VKLLSHAGGGGKGSNIVGWPLKYVLSDETASEGLYAAGRIPFPIYHGERAGEEIKETKKNQKTRREIAP